MDTISFKRHRFPPEIIRRAVWLYARFALSYRDVEDLLAERGLDISYESVRRWFPDVSRGGVSFSFSGGNAMIAFNNGGYIEEGGFRYTCETTRGCEVRNRVVLAGTIVETSI